MVIFATTPKPYIHNPKDKTKCPAIKPETKTAAPKRKSGGQPGPRRQRNAQGWIVPADGTPSRQVYDLLSLNMSPRDIIAMTGLTPVKVHQIIYRIRSPEKHNVKVAAQRANKKGQR